MRVSDVGPGAASAQPRFLTNVNGIVYFNGNDGSTGGELWKTDGTTTTLVKDIVSGSVASYPTNLTNVNGTLFFTVNDGSSGMELWKSDGTSTGTVRVADINPGLSSSSPSYLTNFGGTLFFRADDGVGGNELWKSDGSAAGTVRVKDIRSGIGASNPTRLVVLAGTLYFRANDGIQGEELWKSDGTSAGTVLAMNVSAGSGGSLPDRVALAGNRVAFVAGTQSFGRELYVVSAPPTGIALSSNTIDENLPIGTTVGTLSASDPDPGDVITFSLPAGLGDNNAFAVVGNSLRTASLLNFETKSTYNIVVRAADQFGVVADASLSVLVKNLAELGTPIQIGNGSAARSVVRQLVIDFDSDVIVDTNAFLLQKRTLVNNNVVFDTVSTSFSLATLPSGATRATISFSGAQTYTGGSLADGYYQLTIFGANVTFTQQQPGLRWQRRWYCWW